MTYCLGMLLDEGLILMADTRTNAGVDNFSIYRKLHLLADGPDRTIFACTAGNLSVSQTAISIVNEGLGHAPAEDSDGVRTLHDVPTMFRAAELVGEAMQIATRQVRQALAGMNVSVGASTLLGGRIGDAAPQLYLIYEAGNFIQCKPESPFFQIGETKYGRPILDRELSPPCPLADALKIGFLSFDAAMASNLGVARPIDLMVMPTDRGRPILTRRIERRDPYFDDLSERWGEALSEATRSIPNPPFL
ncbi:MAG TPA: peptidase [Allosphingosinicella sp.]